MNDALTSIDRDGYFVFEDFLSESTCDKLKNCLESLPDGQLVQNKNGDFHGGRTVLAPNVITHSPLFMDLAQDRRSLDIADKYFQKGAFPSEKDPYQLHLMHGRMVAEQAPEQELHIDSRLCGVDPPLVLHIFIYLDDCVGEGSGATRVVPGSHRFNRYSNEEDNKKAIPVYGRKGTAMFLNSNLFHGSSRKVSSGSRWLLTVAYSRWWIRQPFAIPYFTNWPRPLTDAEKALFGFTNYADKNDSPRGLKSRGETPTLVAAS
jgi:ectoine hydroxylase-related dioxygenase (phytanoyl-CoA dioxygenase family)